MNRERKPRAGFGGAIAGIALAAFLGGVSAVFSIAFFEGAAAAGRMLGGGELHLWSLAIAPAVAGIVCGGIKKYIHGAPFCGLADTMLAARRGDSQEWKPAAASVFASFASFAAGASVGQYGPVGHLGGFIGGLFRRRLERGVGAACGVAAAIAAAFNAPVTGLLFAHEVILRHYSPRAFAPVTVAAVAGYTVSVAFGRPPFLSIGEMRAVAASDFVVFGAQGALFGAMAAWYLRAIFRLGKVLSPLPSIPVLAAAGMLCGLLWLLAPEAAGGRDLLRLAVEDGLSGRDALFFGAIKAAATVLCLGAGFAGGVVGPTLGIGALAGVLYAALAAAAGVYDGPLFVPVVCGMIAFTAPVIGAPLAGILFVLELSGGNYPLTVAASLAVALSVSAAEKLGRGSYYEQQLLARGIKINPREM
ncbi:MAG: chloride channel protein [Gammaproteobacteria bacterium]